MKDFIKELLEYTNYYNNAVISNLNDNQDRVSTKAIQLISHIVNAHQIWNAKFIIDNKQIFEAWAIHEPSELTRYEKLNFNKSLEILAAYELDDLIEWKTSSGVPYKNSVRDILFQIINHSNYHRAQIATEFKQRGLTPLVTDFIHYKM